MERTKRNTGLKLEQRNLLEWVNQKTLLNFKFKKPLLKKDIKKLKRVTLNETNNKRKRTRSVDGVHRP